MWSQQSCPPPSSCCCDLWAIPPGQQLVLTVDWSPALATQPNFSLNSIISADLLDVNQSPAVPAVDTEISLVSGMDVDPPVSQPGFTNILGSFTQNIVKCEADTAIGRSYRLNLVAAARDCNGRKIILTECVFINVQACT